MKCDQCKGSIEEGEEREHFGKVLCEDCYMDTLSPARTCDPWAEYSAKSFIKDGITDELTEIQTKILQILQEKGGAEINTLSKILQIKPSDLEREIATLWHMQKVRGKLQEGKKIDLPLVDVKSDFLLYICING